MPPHQKKEKERTGESAPPYILDLPSGGSAREYQDLAIPSAKQSRAISTTPPGNWAADGARPHTALNKSDRRWTVESGMPSFLLPKRGASQNRTLKIVGVLVPVVPLNTYQKGSTMIRNFPLAKFTPCASRGWKQEAKEMQ